MYKSERVREELDGQLYRGPVDEDPSICCGRKGPSPRTGGEKETAERRGGREPAKSDGYWISTLKLILSHEGCRALGIAVAGC